MACTICLIVSWGSLNSGVVKRFSRKLDSAAGCRLCGLRLAVVGGLVYALGILSLIISEFGAGKNRVTPDQMVGSYPICLESGLCEAMGMNFNDFRFMVTGTVLAPGQRAVFQGGRPLSYHSLSAADAEFVSNALDYGRPEDAAVLPEGVRPLARLIRNYHQSLVSFLAVPAAIVQVGRCSVEKII